MTDLAHKALVISAGHPRAQRIMDVLKGHGIVARHVTTGLEAIRAFEERPADLIVSDYPTRDLQDAQMIDRMRGLNQRARFIMIVAPGHATNDRPLVPNRFVSFLHEDFADAELARDVRRILAECDDASNRRRFSRYAMSIDTRLILINPFTNVDGHPIAGLIRDVSRSGISMLSRQIIPVPTMLKLVIDLTHSRQSITMLAKSLSCTLTQIPNVYRVGAKFVGLLPPELEDAIAQWGEENHEAKTTDIFMGKSFRKATEEWLTTHLDSLADEAPARDGETAPRLASEVCATPYDDEED